MGCAQSKKADDVVAAETPAETEPVAADAPVETEAAAEEPAPEAPAPAEEAAAPAEPEAEAAAAEEPAKELFKVTGHEIDDKGIVFYTVEAVEGDASFKKRFSEFKTLVVELGSPKSLPALPSSLASKLRGKHNPALLKEREEQLTVMLNAIANDAELAEKEPFKKFVE